VITKEDILKHRDTTALGDLALPPANREQATPRNWWKLQAGRFKNDPTFAEFVGQVQIARKQGD